MTPRNQLENKINVSQYYGNKQQGINSKELVPHLLPTRSYPIKNIICRRAAILLQNVFCHVEDHWMIFIGMYGMNVFLSLTMRTRVKTLALIIREHNADKIRGLGFNVESPKVECRP